MTFLLANESKFKKINLNYIEIYQKILKNSYIFSQENMSIIVWV